MQKRHKITKMGHKNTTKPLETTTKSHKSILFIMLTGGDSHCAGTLELKHLDDWRPVEASAWTLKAAAVFYSIRLLNGKSLCSGRLEVRSNQSNHQWSSVCEDDFDRHDAEVVCRELSCGAPLTFQGALFGKAAAPIQKKEFQCAGNESGLLECKSSDSGGNTCSPDRAGGLICSEPVRLVGGDSRCAGTLELKDAGVWRPVDASGWTLEAVGPVCLHLGCGPAVSVGERREFSDKPAWLIERYCDLSGLDLRECITYWHSSSAVNLVCFGNWSHLCAVMSVQATRGQRPSRQQNMELVVCTLYVSAAEERPDEEGEAQAAEQDLHGTHLISP
uniref:SRCR domain-containing protein n=1 Tax=Acanthochromis polyacanthus TaxID=80966 RepID=A0A3Q1FM31_9TELE